jgi:hypothetical protein
MVELTVNDDVGLSTAHAAELLDIVTALNECRFTVSITHDKRGKQQTNVTMANELQIILTIYKRNHLSTSDFITTNVGLF